MPAVLAAIARPLVQFIITTAFAYLVQKIVAPILEQMVGTVAAHYNIPQTDAKVIVANTVIENAAFIAGGVAALKSRLPLVAADYLGLSASGFAKQKLSATAAATVAAVDANPAAATAAKSTFARLFTGENTWRLIITIMGAQQIGDWFIFGRPQLQGYIDAIFGKGTLKLPTAPSGPPPWSDADWTNYYTGLEQQGIVGIEGGAVAATLLYSRDALVQLAWWAYSEQLKKGVNPTEANVKTIIYPHLRFASTPAPAASAPAAGASSSGAARSAPAAAAPSTSGAAAVPSTTVVPALSTAAGPAVKTEAIDNAEELQQAAAAALTAFLQGLPGKLTIEIKSTTSYVDDSGQRRYAGVLNVQTGVSASGQPQIKHYAGHFAMLNVYYLEGGDNRKLVEDIPIGTINVGAYRPAAAELAQIAAIVAGGAAAQTPVIAAGSAAASSSSAQITVAAGGNAASTPSAEAAAPAAPAPAAVAPSVPTAPTQEQLLNRLNPKAVVLSLPTEGTIYRVAGDDTRGVVYKIVGGVPQTISSTTEIANTNIRLASGVVWKQGEPLPPGESDRGGEVLDPNFRGAWWTNIYDRQNWDRQNGAGSWAALPVFNQADIQTVLGLNGGKLPNTGSYTLNAS